MEKYKNFAQRFKDLRKYLGLNQGELAEKMGYSTHVPISRIEQGKSLPGVENLIKLSGIYDGDLHWLLTGKDSPTAEKAAIYLAEELDALAPCMAEIMQYLLKKRLELMNASLEIKNKENQTKKDKDELNNINDELEDLSELFRKGIKVSNWIDNPFETEKEKN